MKTYTMKQGVNVAQQAKQDILRYLHRFEKNVEVIDVEDEPEYQKIDVDLLWKRNADSGVITQKLEIKGDRYYHTGNFFFETISNQSKNTPGCFMYTQADYLLYYFVEVKELHILPMPQTRDWFSPRINEFKERTTSTPVGGGSYRTVGRLVPRTRVKNEVANVKIIDLRPFL